MDHEEARRKHLGGKILGFFFWKFTSRLLFIWNNVRNIWMISGSKYLVHTLPPCLSIRQTRRYRVVRMLCNLPTWISLPLDWKVTVRSLFVREWKNNRYIQWYKLSLDPRGWIQSCNITGVLKKYIIVISSKPILTGVCIYFYCKQYDES